MSTLTEKLNEQVATWSVLYTKLHNFHWYVKGPQFFTLHAKFEELYNVASQNMDDIAERMLTRGERPTALLREHLNLSVVEEASGKESAEQMVETLASDFDLVMNALTEAMTLASREGDDMTEDLLNGIYQEIEKHQWMLRAFLGERNDS